MWMPTSQRPIGEVLDGEGVVMVLRVGGVDGEDVEGRAVHAPVPALPPSLLDDLLGRGLDFLRKLEVQSIPEENGKDIHSRGRNRTQDPLHGAHRVQFPVPVGRNPGNDDVPRFRPCLLSRGDQHVSEETVIQGNHISESPGFLEGPHHRGVGPIQDLDDATLGVPTLRAALHPHHHLIPIHRRIQEGSGHEHIPAAILADDETVLVPGDLEDAHLQVDLLRTGVALPLDPVQAALALHRSEAAPGRPGIPRWESRGPWPAPSLSEGLFGIP